MTTRLNMTAVCLIALGIVMSACSREFETSAPVAPTLPVDSVIGQKFGGRIDLNNLANYANQPVPAYITKDNSGANPITDEGATLGRHPCAMS
ncbi:MAG: hypothetical protein QNL91_08385 [Candidatus Krumholzibacteria bacterium]|nr:hypothetical protein [Candidatus Krumholzibacteria bacterium]